MGDTPFFKGQKMKLKDLLSDPQAVDKFDVLGDELAAALASIRGGNECESIAEILPESIAKAEEDYAALVLAVGNMNEFFKSPDSSESPKIKIAPQLSDPIDETGMIPSVPCVTEFYRSGQSAAVTAIFKFESRETYLDWSFDEMWKFCEIAADRNIEKFIFTAPEMTNEGYERVLNNLGEIEYAAF
ncbi:MAG: hypothetical protein NT070_14145 [Cyanobacteria bacterium]|nr:hypothetical protein [Cyanobacteriota bacterium]